MNSLINKYTNKPLSNIVNDTIINYDKKYMQKLFQEPFKNTKNINILMCVLSSLIYKYYDNELINKTCNSWNLSEDNYNIYNIEDKKIVFGIFVIEKNIIVTFKGSSTFSDFLDDINFQHYDCPEDYTLGTIHQGFYNRLFDIETVVNGKNVPRCKVIVDLLLKYPETYNVYLTGHSLGGGLATAFYNYLKKNIKNEIQLITFGSPRVGDSVFVKSTISTRIVNKNDIIPHLPLSIFGYRHIQTEKKIPEINTQLFRELNWWSMEDHGIDKYFESLL